MTHTYILQELVVVVVVVVVMRAVARSIRNKKIIFSKLPRSLQIALMEQNIPQVDDAHYIDLVMPRYVLIEYSDSDRKH